MVRWIKPWSKKRGDRRTGSRLLGRLGEAIFFAALLVVGFAALLFLLVMYYLGRWPADASPLGIGLGILVLVAFVLVGAIGVIYCIVRVGTSAERRAALAKSAANIDLIRDATTTPQDFPNVPRDTDLTNSPGVTLAYRLPIVRSPAWRLFATALFCIVWNVIAVTFAIVSIGNHLSGSPDWLLTVVAIPFAMTGIWSIHYFVRLWMMTTGIGPTSIEISNHPLYPGQKYEIQLSQFGRQAIRSLEISMVCLEEATYRQGTDVRTESRRVFQQRVLHLSEVATRRGVPLEDCCCVEIPRQVMHSFQSENNSIQWMLEVCGEAGRWPPFCRQFPVVVYPDCYGEMQA